MPLMADIKLSDQIQKIPKYITGLIVAIFIIVGIDTFMRDPVLVRNMILGFITGVLDLIGGVIDMITRFWSCATDGCNSP